MIEPDDRSEVTNTVSSKPLFFEPLKAYRHWDVKGGLLAAPCHSSYRWTPGENVAFCSRINKSSVECAKRGEFRDCGCGFYSVWTTDHSYARHSNLMKGEVFGVVELYGAVTLGSEGARAAKAKVAALHLPPSPWSPFNRGRSHPVMETYLDTRFYRSRDNLIVAEGVERPDNIMDKTRRYGAFG